MTKEEKKKERINLRTEFLLFSCMSMGILVICMYLLINSIISDFNNAFKEQSVRAGNGLMNSIISLLDEKNLVLNEEGKNVLKKMVLKITPDDGVNLVVILDKKENVIAFANNPSILNQQFNASNIYEFLVSKNFKIDQDVDVLEHESPGSQYKVFIVPTKGQFAGLNRINNEIKLMFLIALVFSMMISFMLSQRIIKPINNLITGAKEFAQGHFDFRLDKTKYIEINNLVDSYNLMADNLHTFYDSLEQKVKDRTAELEVALNQLKNTQSMMVHAEKMKSLGGLVAGISHEINNPVNFIYGNLIHLNNYSSDLISLGDKYSELDTNLSEDKLKDAIKMKKDMDYGFLKEDLPSLLNSCKEGTERTKNIIQDLKNFSRVDANVVSTVNLAKEIDTTLNILTNKFKNRINIHKEYVENLPTIEGLGGQINQVLMNILDNAIFAIKDKGDIYIRLNYTEECVLIEIEDTGCGMPPDAIKKIFEPFYTTKPVGQGTGLGMSISYKVIKTHSGSVEVVSKEGKGTKFRIKLPIQYTPNEQALAR